MLLTFKVQPTKKFSTTPMVEAVTATYRKFLLFPFIPLALLVVVFTQIRNLLLHISKHTLTNFEAIPKMKTIERDRAKAASDKLLIKITESTLISLTNMYLNLWTNFSQLFRRSSHKLIKVKRVKFSMSKTLYLHGTTNKMTQNNSTVQTKTQVLLKKHLPALHSVSSNRFVQRIN